MDDNISSYLDEYWLTPVELEAISHLTIRQAQIHRALQPESNTQEDPPEETNPERPSLSKPKSISLTKNQHLLSNVYNPNLFFNPIDDSSSKLSPHRSERSNQGSQQSMRYVNEVFWHILQPVIIPPLLLTWLIRLN